MDVWTCRKPPPLTEREKEEIRCKISLDNRKVLARLSAAKWHACGPVVVSQDPSTSFRVIPASRPRPRGLMQGRIAAADVCMCVCVCARARVPVCLSVCLFYPLHNTGNGPPRARCVQAKQLTSGLHETSQAFFEMSTCPITEAGERGMEQVSLIITGEALAKGVFVCVCV